MQCIVPKHLFGRDKFASGVLLGLLRGNLLLLFLGSEFGLAFHGTLSGLLKENGKGFARAMEFATNGVRRLIG